MPVDLSSYRVAAGEKPASSNKQNNMMAALEAYTDGIPIADLANYPASSSQYLDGSGNWSTPSIGGFVTALPGSPSNGAVCVFEADATNRIYWHLMYKQSIAKWVKIGGPPLLNYVATTENTTSTSFVDLATAQSITAPLAGDYLFTVAATASGSTSGTQLRTGVKVGAAAATTTATSRASGGTGADEVFLGGIIRASVAASDALKLQFNVGAGTGYFRLRTLTVDPVFVS